METVSVPDMDRLATFLAVVEHGSFRKAAAARFLSHSTVQKQMRTLERDIGFALFERSGRSVVLKRRAGDLADVARTALVACEELQQRIDQLRNSESNTLRVTAAPVHMANKLGVTVRQVQESANFRVQPILLSHDDKHDDDALVHQLRSGATDVVVSVRELPGCESFDLWPLELVAVVPLDFAKTMKRGLSVATLGSTTVFAQDKAMWSRRQLDALIKGAKINVVTEALPEVCISLARAGMGIAVVASDNVAPESQDVLPLLNAHGKRIEASVKANWIPENDSENLRTFLGYFD